MRLDCGPCVIRSWRLEDAASLARHANDRRVSINLRDRFPFPYSLEDAKGYLAFVTSEKPETSFALEVNGEAVGGIGLMLHGDVERVSAEIGYWLGVAFWGRGIVPAALRELTRYAFAQHPLTRIFALPFTTNAASIRVLEKVGYVREGVLRRAVIKDGQVLDSALYAIYDDTAPGLLGAVPRGPGQGP
jgi:RimJ/RimL family protein N-acetyltransferase